jgi:DeoR family transcriptional regulator of aga operon
MPDPAHGEWEAGVPRGTLRRADRVSAILGQLASAGTVDAGELAEQFDVSAATIRRDLRNLEDQRLLRRTHGGALAADVSPELAVRYRIGQRRETKLAVARRAVTLLPPGPLILGLTGGTTTQALASQAH